MDYTLLIVDDEESILNSLRRQLRSTGYRVLTATSGQEGLAIMATHAVQVVLSDQRMPGMSGAEFLTEVNARHPATIRMVLSGYSDFAGLTEAVNNGNIFKFLVKPWDTELLKANIAEAFAHYQMIEKGAQFTKIYENTQEGIIITDSAANIQAVNPAFSHITGYTQEDVVGRTPAILRSDRHGDAFFSEMWSALLAKGQWVGEIWNRRKCGEVYPELLNISAIRDAQNQVQQYVGLFSDITIQKRTEEILRHQAYHDPLTRLPNRLMFAEHLQLALSQAARYKRLCAVLLLDLDHFKDINDTYGHEFGDKLLVRVAEHLDAGIRKGDTLARMGGDEFTILLPLVEDVMDARHVASKILKIFGASMLIDSTELFVSPSIGIAVYPGDGADGETLLKNADAAMYRAKTSGRNNYQFYTADMNLRSQRRLMLENELHRAFEAGMLDVHYQPKVRLGDGTLVGAEALMRWLHPEHGWISPAEFIPIAEEGGLILPLGDWLIRRVTQDIAAWRRTGLRPPPIALNISSRQIQHQSLERILADALASSALSPAALELEITESTIMDNADRNIEALVMLKRMGFPIAIDDFGTGYSSLSYLRRFPVDVLKVDQSFIRDICAEPACAELVRGVINMAHGLHLCIVAEGVETQAQHDALKAFGCDIVQGFLTGRPQPAADFATLIASSAMLDASARSGALGAA